ncbi:MAG: 30S ribosomal protein S2 [Verrucomicrobia bacterium]|nr:30S ribosomal protein S2 [Verrucomicrobiota bacterium]
MDSKYIARYHLTVQEKREPKVSIKQLLEAGVHFGHQTRRWNPKMKRFIFEARNGIHILDLSKTLHQIRVACEEVEKVVERRQSILFVGTKKQAKTVIQECAEECGEFYVAERWLGGMLTNLTTIRQSVKQLERIEKKIASGGEGLKKKEIYSLSKVQGKLEKNLSGIRAMRKPPGLLIIVDPSKEHIAVAEAKKLRIPVMAIVDTNCDPDLIDYVIAGNDDALKSNKVILQALMRAIVEKKEALNIPIGVVEVVEEKEKPAYKERDRKPKRHHGERHNPEKQALERKEGGE